MAGVTEMKEPKVYAWANRLTLLSLAVMTVVLMIVVVSDNSTSIIEANVRLDQSEIRPLVVEPEALNQLQHLHLPDSSACVCASLAPKVSGPLTCDVSSYSFSWGNKICEGILPACVLQPSSAEDVAAAVRFATTNSLNISVRSGGHSYTCNMIKPGSLHLDLRSLNSTELRPAASGNGTELALGPGNTMVDLLDALEPGQMIVHGQCPTVGGGGLFLHGGYHTTLTLKYGRGNDTVVAMEVVTADGRILQLSDMNPYDGLWMAMRQAGSSFAIATKIVVKVIEDYPAELPTDGGMMYASRLKLHCCNAGQPDLTRPRRLSTAAHA